MYVTVMEHVDGCTQHIPHRRHLLLSLGLSPTSGPEPCGRRAPRFTCTGLCLDACTGKPPSSLADAGTRRLVDFSWAGEAGDARYLSTIFSGDPKLYPWHPEVKRGSLIKKEHDNYLLDKVVCSNE